jgi:hypothetical protein
MSCKKGPEKRMKGRIEMNKKSEEKLEVKE